MSPLELNLTRLLEKMSAAPEIDWRAPVNDIRKRFWEGAHKLESDAPKLLDISALQVGGADGVLPARLYVPFAPGAPTSAVVVYFHGGGFVTGDLDSHEMVCRRLADAARMRVVSVAYRLAPEHRFPAAPEDAIAATRWVIDHAGELGVDASRVAVAGDSAGGNLAAVTAQQFKKRGLPKLAAQLLIYPLTQFLQMTPSQIRLKAGYGLTQAAQDWFRDNYLPNREAALDPMCSPLIENDLAGLPPARIVTAGFDPLMDEGRAYADKLQACGVATDHAHYPNQLHGFFNLTAVSGHAKQAIEACGDWLTHAVASR
jgi:acetyl esterase